MVKGTFFYASSGDDARLSFIFFIFVESCLTFEDITPNLILVSILFSSCFNRMIVNHRSI